jgi:hypothetical protein
VSKIKTPAGLLASPVFVREALSSNQSMTLEGEYSSQQIDIAAKGTPSRTRGFSAHEECRPHRQDAATVAVARQ